MLICMYKKSTIFYQIGIISGMWITDINYFRFPFLFDKLVKTQDQSLLRVDMYVVCIGLYDFKDVCQLSGLYSIPSD